MDFNLTMKQAEHMADAIMCSRFWMAGNGHFDLNREELAEVLIAAFSKNRYANCRKVYDKFYDKKMR